MTDDLLPVAEARAKLLSLVHPLPAETCAIAAALGRALCEDVRATRTLPPWNNSAMDGYAVRSEDVAAVPARLRIVETLHAGQLPQRRVGPGECSRIMTGAPVPEGADAVVMQERVRALGEEEIEVLEPAAKRSNVRDRGDDARAGEVLLPKGTALGIPEAALLWAQGLTHASVSRRPRVAILSSGDELCAVDQPTPGRIVDTNSPSIAEAVRRAGGEPTLLGIAADRLEAVLGKLEQAKGHDVVLTSAGVSVGAHDFVRPALERLGAQLSFWRVAIKPGKPLAVGTLGTTLFVGLPGNPVSSLVTFELFVRPALRRMCGVGDVEPLRIRGQLDGHLSKSPGTTHYLRAAARWEGGQVIARPLAMQGSGALRSAASATHLIELPPEATEVASGAEVTLLPVSWT